VHAGHKVLMKLADNAVLNDGNPQGVLSQEHLPRPIHLLNAIFIINFSLNYMFILLL